MVILNLKKYFKHRIKTIILFLIYHIEKYELRKTDLSDKIIDTISLTNLSIYTDTGFEKVSSIHKTKPFYLWRITLKNGYTLEGADEHIIFDKNMKEIFIKDLKIGDIVQTDCGAQEIISIKEKTKYPVCMYDVSVDSPNHRFYSNGILSHNTTTIAAFFAWYLCFHTDRNLLILANKEKTAVEIIAKVMDVFRGLPFFLKPGIINTGATGMRLDNGCQLISQATTKTASIGFTIHVLYADEFAHIAPNIVGDFWRSVYPTLASSSISQCIISSTPSGQSNLFFEIWDKATKSRNSFKYKRVDYWQVPEHDEEWAASIKADFGEESFAQEFELKFNSDSKLLLGSKESAFLKRIEQEYTFEDLDRMKLEEELYRSLKWHPNFDPNEEYHRGTELFVISVDTGEGRDEDEAKDNDYNILTIYKAELKSKVQLKKLRNDELHLKNMFRLNQIGLYRDNLKDDAICAKVAKDLVFEQLGPENCLVVIEMNFNGKFFLNIFSDHDEYYEGVVMSSYHTKPIPGTLPPRKKSGFKVGNDREHFCKAGRTLIRSKTLVPNDEKTILEFASFGKDRRGKYRGIGTHDDTVMATLNVSRLYEESSYEDRLYDLLDNMHDSDKKRYVNNLLSRLEENSDVSDEAFASIYNLDNNSEPTTINNINEIFKTGEQSIYRYKVPTNYFNKKDKLKDNL